MSMKKEHPVWSILRKTRYVPEFYPEAEAIYDFIKSLCMKAGSITYQVCEASGHGSA